MVEIRLHARGGQKLAAWAEALALAALKDGHYSQTCLSFGLDRRGAPNTAIVRVADTPIRRRAENASRPHVVVVLDPTLVGLVDVTAGLVGGGTVLVPAGTRLVLPADAHWHLVPVETTGLAPTAARAALLGAAARVTRAASARAVEEAIGQLINEK